MSCGVGRRHGSDPVLLWLWHRPVATVPIGPLAWEPAYAAGAALKRQKDQKKKKKNSSNQLCFWASPLCFLSLDFLLDNNNKIQTTTTKNPVQQSSHLHWKCFINWKTLNVIIIIVP